MLMSDSSASGGDSTSVCFRPDLPQLCGGHGSCDERLGRCVCDVGYTVDSWDRQGLSCHVDAATQQGLALVVFVTAVLQFVLFSGRLGYLTGWLRVPWVASRWHFGLVCTFDVCVAAVAGAEYFGNRFLSGEAWPLVRLLLCLAFVLDFLIILLFEYLYFSLLFLVVNVADTMTLRVFRALRIVFALIFVDFVAGPFATLFPGFFVPSASAEQFTVAFWGHFCFQEVLSISLFNYLLYVFFQAMDYRLMDLKETSKAYVRSQTLIRRNKVYAYSVTALGILSIGVFLSVAISPALRRHMYILEPLSLFLGCLLHLPTILLFEGFVGWQAVDPDPVETIMVQLKQDTATANSTSGGATAAAAAAAIVTPPQLYNLGVTGSIRDVSGGFFRWDRQNLQRRISVSEHPLTGGSDGSGGGIVRSASSQSGTTVSDDGASSPTTLVHLEIVVE